MGLYPGGTLPIHDHSNTDNGGTLGASVVGATQLSASAVTTAKIADANVTTAKIADANVTTVKILDANVATAKIADANVTTVKILDANVTAAKMAAASGVRVIGTQLIQNPYAISSTVTLAHGLGQTPDEWVAYLECLTAEFGYSIGDRIRFTETDGATTRSGSIGGDATNLVLTTTATVPGLVRKDTRAVINITPANWKLVATPYKNK